MQSNFFIFLIFKGRQCLQNALSKGKKIHTLSSELKCFSCLSHLSLQREINISVDSRAVFQEVLQNSVIIFYLDYFVFCV